MNALETIKESRTITPSQWDEIAKFVQLGKIKNAIADLLEAAPELEFDSVFDFIHGLVVREMKARNRPFKTFKHNMPVS